MEKYKFKFFCWKLRRYLSWQGVDVSKMSNEYIRHRLSLCMIKEALCDIGYGDIGVSAKDIETAVNKSVIDVAKEIFTSKELSEALKNLTAPERR